MSNIINGELMNKSVKAVAFTGPSNSGKTSIILKVSKILQEKGYKVTVIKHDPANKAQFDTKGKDSWEFFQTNANVVVLSPKRTTFFTHEAFSFEEIVSFVDTDFLLVEGLKTLPLPRIYIARKEVEPSYLRYISAIAALKEVKIQKNFDHEILNLDNPEEITNWIIKNAKILKG